MTSGGVRALTVRQPYASLIVAGAKAVETRTRPVPEKYLGRRIAVHAGESLASMTGNPEILGDWMAFRGGGNDRDYPFLRRLGGPEIRLAFGSVIGSVRIVGCVPVERIVWDDHAHIGDEDPSWSTSLLFDDPDREGARVAVRERPLGYFDRCGWAWLLSDAKPCEHLCPYGCRPGGPGVGHVVDVVRDGTLVGLELCPVCDGAGTCAPVRARGRLGFWKWSV